MLDGWNRTQWYQHTTLQQCTKVQLYYVMVRRKICEHHSEQAAAISQSKTKSLEFSMPDLWRFQKEQIQNTRQYLSSC